MGEFWQAEADRNGTTAAEELQSFYAEEEQARLADEARLREPENALKFLNDEIETNNKGFDVENDDPECWVEPVERVLEVLEVEVGWSFKTNHTMVRARAVGKSGLTGEIRCCVDNYAGSFYEPPSGETNAEWKWEGDGNAR